MLYKKVSYQMFTLSTLFTYPLTTSWLVAPIYPAPRLHNTRHHSYTIPITTLKQYPLPFLHNTHYHAYTIPTTTLTQYPLPRLHNTHYHACACVYAFQLSNPTTITTTVVVIWYRSMVVCHANLFHLSLTVSLCPRYYLVSPALYSAIELYLVAII